MDEQFEQMGYFQQALINFNERLKASMQDLEACHDNVSPHWQDAMRREYDAEWQPLKTQMDHYVASEGPGYVEFLAIKLHALRRYSYGS